MMRETILHLSAEDPVDVFVTHLSLTERLQAADAFFVQLESPDEDLSEKLLGQSVVVSLRVPGSDTRFFYGVVTEMGAGVPLVTEKLQYKLTITPPFGMLKEDIRYRRFQAETLADIIHSIAREYAVHDVHTDTLYQSQQKFAYRVQYGESSYDFLSRLLAEQGAWFYLTHESDAAHLRCTDDSSVLWKDQITFPIERLSGKAERCRIDDDDYLSRKQRKRSATLQHFATLDDGHLTDDATSEVKNGHRYPAFGLMPDNTASFHQRTAERAEYALGEVLGSSRLSTVALGCGFTYTGADYYITEVTHTVAPDATDGSIRYHNHFLAHAQSDHFRPEKIDKPREASVQSACVVGRAKQIRDLDATGRCFLQFYWDGMPQWNEQASIRFPVATCFGGKSYGAQLLPDITDRVTVGFWAGDVETPVVLAEQYTEAILPVFPFPRNAGLTTLASARDDGKGWHFFLINSAAEGLGQFWKASGSLQYQCVKAYDRNVGEALSEQIAKAFLHEQKSGETTAKKVDFEVGGTIVSINPGGVLVKSSSIGLQGGSNGGAGGASAGATVSGIAAAAIGSGGGSKPVARKGDPHKCPKREGDRPHNGGPILTGAPGVTIDGKPVARKGDKLHCDGTSDKDTIVQGSPNVTINGIPVARKGDKCDHGGKILDGAAWVRS